MFKAKWRPVRRRKSGKQETKASIQQCLCSRVGTIGSTLVQSYRNPANIRAFRRDVDRLPAR